MRLILSFLLVGMVLLSCTPYGYAKSRTQHSNDLNAALLNATQQGNTKKVKVLLAQGASVRTKDKDDTTALIWAARVGNIECVKALVAKGADINAKDRFGDTALIGTALKGETAILQFLLFKHANINAKDNVGFTPLIVAAGAGNTSSVALLLKKGANINASDRHGTTALGLSISRGHKETEQVLRKAGAKVRNTVVNLAPNAPKDKPVRAKAQEMDAAILPYVEKAKKTYPQAKQRFLAGLPQGQSFFITTRLHDKQGRTELTFVAVKQIQNGIVKGLIANDMTLEGYKNGDSISFPEAEMVDWTISKPDGTEEGNVVGNFLDTYQH